MFSGHFAHPLQIAMPSLDGHIQVHPRQLVAEGALMEIALNLAHTADLFLRPRPLAAVYRCAFHRFSHSKYTDTSGKAVKAPSRKNCWSINAVFASEIYFSIP